MFLASVLAGWEFLVALGRRVGVALASPHNARLASEEAVFAAYAAATGNPAWSPEMTDEAILEQLLALNLQRAGG